MFAPNSIQLNTTLRSPFCPIILPCSIMASGKPSRSEVDSDNLLESAVLGLQSFANDASTFLGLCHKESPGIDSKASALLIRWTASVDEDSHTFVVFSIATSTTCRV